MLFYYIAFLCILFTNAIDECQTPNNFAGKCKPIDECPLLQSFFENENQTPTPSEASYLKKSLCGFSNANPKVCCPVDALLNNTSCGHLLSKKIYGGNQTELDEFPWMALLESQTSNGTKQFVCSGALISKRYVLTAGHCADFPLVNVRLGEYDTESEIDCMPDPYSDDENCAPPPVNLPIEEKIIHENYKRNNVNRYNDIALLRLKHDVEFSDYIKPICLPQFSERNFYINYDFSVAGWGKTEKKIKSNVKLKVELPPQNKSDCENIYRTLNYKLKLSEGQLCVGGLKGKDSCVGDSGGPLMRVRKKNKELMWYAEGLVSFGINLCGVEGWPGIYTNVSSYVPWIIRNIKP